ncbi:MAG: hypothetical protein EXS25_08410 [Pedosphaera sp.]|nr:hypothetical protein [Pedosphaera sp.]
MQRHLNSSSSQILASDPPLPVFIAVDLLPEAPPTQLAQPIPYRQIKLALDVHAGDLMVVRRGDGGLSVRLLYSPTENFKKPSL